MKKCPFCAEEIQDEAIKCKHCGSMLLPPQPQLPIAPEQMKIKSLAIAVSNKIPGLTVFLNNNKLTIILSIIVVVVAISIILILHSAKPTGMELIPAGCFNMGDAFNEGQYELPVHKVCITRDFYMYVYEVTNAEYAACVSGGGCTAPADSTSHTRGSYYGNATYNKFPVINVNWNQARDYCIWAGKRLPTEAEWEYAARGGLEGKRYPWGDSISGANANYRDSGDAWDNDTSPVGNYAANGYGLYDMSGNVSEWINGWWSGTYSTSPTNDPPGPGSGTDRVFRGGSWNYGALDLRVSSRNYGDPTSQYDVIGFRCAGN